MGDNIIGQKIRPAVAEDFACIADIYAEYVMDTTVTFETLPPTAAEMFLRWERAQQLNAPFLVVVVAGKVVGYAYAGAYRSRPAYAHTVENSIYLARGWTGRGIGRHLLERLINDCTERGLAQMIAVIAGANNFASVRLHQSCGFVTVGCLKGVGYKFGQWLDTTLMQRAL